MTIKIGYDAGHGINTPGKRCAKALDPKETREWTLNDRIARYVEEGLKDYTGYEFRRFDDRTGVRDVPLAERTKKANDWKADIYISVHHNAGANGGAGGGITVYRYPNSSKMTQAMLKQVYDLLIKHTGLKGNRSKPLNDTNFQVLRQTKMAAVLVEHGFMDSRTDVPIILTDKFARDSAKGHVEFLVEQFKLKKNNKPTTTKLYRVRKNWADATGQKGAYANLDNAISKAKELSGYKVFDDSGKVVYENKPTPAPKPGNQVSISGESVATAEQMAAFLIKNNPKPKIDATPREFCKMFLEEGTAEGIRGDIAFCQAIHETGWFNYGGQVLPEQNNFCGLGATNNSPVGKGAWFPTERDGIRAQIQHLKAYANKDSLKNGNIDPRFHLVTRGIAPNWVDLNGRWAVPGPTYGQSILSLFDELLKIVVEEKPVDSNKAEMKKLQEEIAAITKELEKYKGKIDKVKDIVNR